MMELGVGGTFKRRLKPGATPNVPVVMLKITYLDLLTLL
jgi:hypothetical protein